MNGKKKVAGLVKPIGNRKSVGVSFYLEGGKGSISLQFVRPIKQLDFNNDGSIKTCALSFRHKRQLVTGLRISKTAAIALRDALDEILLALYLLPSTS